MSVVPAPPNPGFSETVHADLPDWFLGPLPPATGTSPQDLIAATRKLLRDGPHGNAQQRARYCAWLEVLATSLAAALEEQLGGAR